MHSVAGAEHGRHGAQSGHIGEGIAFDGEQVSIEAGGQPPLALADPARLSGQ